MAASPGSCCLSAIFHFQGFIWSTAEQSDSKFDDRGRAFRFMVKLFDKWSYDDIQWESVNPELVDYISVHEKYHIVVPFRYQGNRFHKVNYPLVGRLVCDLMQHGRSAGKKLLAIRIVRSAFDLTT
jgi:hypothetical protein